MPLYKNITEKHTSEKSPDNKTFSFGHVYTVSSLTSELKNILEEQFPFIWISGEISNYSLPSSGHAYFSLKDKNALINCVMFKNQRNRLIFALENGIKIIGIARLALYEPRGTYQLIFEHVESYGAGDLQIRYEQLKKQLALEGLFDESHKKELPFLPSKIFIITSPTGAVIQDIINVTQRRFQGISLQVVPVKVQGEDAENEIKDAIELVNNIAANVEFDKSNGQNSSYAIIIARGGGSLEDLSPFNSEIVARAVFASKIPIISAVGHETDFTICDFVADVRAATPSAAAEIVVPEKRELQKAVSLLQNRLAGSIAHQIDILKNRRNNLHLRLKNPISKVHDMRIKLDDIEHRLINRINEQLRHNKEKLDWISNALYALNPIAVLDRGYSITILCNDISNDDINKESQNLNQIYSNYGKTLINSADASQGDTVMVILSKGKLICKVDEAI